MLSVHEAVCASFRIKEGNGRGPAVCFEDQFRLDNGLVCRSIVKWGMGGKKAGREMFDMRGENFQNKMFHKQ